jgi:perosamine synthetase
MIVRPKQIIYPLKYFGLSSAMAKVTERAFEEHLARFLGSKVYVKVIGRARAGLYLLTKLAVRDAKRKVILSPYTIPDVVNMVRFAGGEPVFVDFVPRSTNIDVDHLSDLIDEQTCCVIVTHYHFNQGDMTEICRLCASNGIMLVEDCALAFGSPLPDTRNSSTTTASVYSFSGFKTLNFFWGGAIATASAELARRLSEEIDKWPQLLWHDYVGPMIKLAKYDVLTRNWVFPWFTFPLLKWKAQRLQKDVLPMVRVESTDLDDTILSRPSMHAIREWDRKLGMVDAFIRHRRNIAAIYISELQDHLVAGETSKEVREASCLVNCPIDVDSKQRGEIIRRIFDKGFDVGASLYPNVHELQGFSHIAGRSDNVARLVRSVVTLPTHPRISEEYAHQLSTVIRHTIG